MHKPTQRVIDILSLLASREDLNLSEISKELNIPIGTLHPILQSLEALDFVSQKSRGYKLGLGVLKLAGAVNSDALSIFKKHMQNISKLCSQVCQLGVLKGGYVLYLHKVESGSILAIKSLVGTLYPAYATALGKCLLCEMSSQDLAKIYPENLAQITPYTTQSLHALCSELEEIKARGWGIESAQMDVQIECLAVPIYSAKGIIAAISVSYPIFYASRDFRARIIDALLKCKAGLEDELRLCCPDITFP